MTRYKVIDLVLKKIMKIKQQTYDATLTTLTPGKANVTFIHGRNLWGCCRRETGAVADILCSVTCTENPRISIIYRPVFT